MGMMDGADLEAEMKSSPEIIKLLKDDAIAHLFYAALCNMQWEKIDFCDTEEAIVHRLKGENPALWSCTWRYAGGIIAAIRDEHYSTNEDYMDFYCGGEEGIVSDTVRDALFALKWRPVPYD